MTKSTISVIGAGRIGQAIAGLAVRQGHPVVLSNSRGPETLQAVVDELGPLASSDTAAGAAAQGDIVVIAVTFDAIESLPVADLTGKVVLDATNYYAPRDGVIPAVEGDRVPTSVHVQRALLGAHVVKAFNHIVWSDIPADARPSDALGRRGIAVAGDDLPSKQRVTEFVDEIGFDPVDIGALDESWRIQRGSPGWITNYSAEQLLEKITEANSWHNA
ncbi:NADPH-dependent F420 reductase [Microbacterium sp. 2C]|nr:NADPH-dependent F420 reductase [Microbacterium paulum]